MFLRNGLEPWHLILIVAVFVMLFGYKKLPDAARGLGKSMRILKSEAQAMKNDGTPAPSATSTSGAATPAPGVITAPAATVAAETVTASEKPATPAP